MVYGFKEGEVNGYTMIDRTKIDRPISKKVKLTPPFSRPESPESSEMVTPTLSYCFLFDSMISKTLSVKRNLRNALGHLEIIERKKDHRYNLYFIPSTRGLVEEMHG